MKHLYKIRHAFNLKCKETVSTINYGVQEVYKKLDVINKTQEKNIIIEHTVPGLRLLIVLL